MIREDREQWAEDHGYSHYICPQHGGFWSDSGPHCESCPEPDKSPAIEEEE